MPPCPAISKFGKDIKQRATCPKEPHPGTKEKTSLESRRFSLGRKRLPVVQMHGHGIFAKSIGRVVSLAEPDFRSKVNTGLVCRMEN